MGSIIKKIILGLVLAGVVFAVINSDFIGKNVRYALFRRYPVDPTTQFNEGQVKAEANMLWINNLDIKAPIIYIDERNEAAYQQALQRGVVHFPGTAKPGELGNAYIFGHSSDYPWGPGDYKTVFALLPRIKEGEEIRVTDEQGNLYTYVVTRQFVVDPDDTSVLDQNNYQGRILTLQTSYPIGTALRRYIVVAEFKGD